MAFSEPGCWVKTSHGRSSGRNATACGAHECPLHVGVDASASSGHVAGSGAASVCGGAGLRASGRHRRDHRYCGASGCRAWEPGCSRVNHRPRGRTEFGGSRCGALVFAAAVESVNFGCWGVPRANPVQTPGLRLSSSQTTQSPEPEAEGGTRPKDSPPKGCAVLLFRPNRLLARVGGSRRARR
jgi:hypothetical protein